MSLHPRAEAMKPSLARMQTLANVAGAALLWWLAAPLLSIGSRHPFDGVAARVGGLLGIGLLAALAWAALQQLRRRRNARLFEQVVGANAAASEALVERFSSAMRLLRAGIAVAGGNRARWWRRGRQIYQLPWYVFIGAPGAGKTTALLHSGLRFPLAERLGAAPVAGVGGTRQCDWWFTDQAVFIDTAGRYTTQDSHAASDSQEWQLFLQLLRRYRPVQPINGVIVTVSVPDLVQGGAELEHQALQKPTKETLNKILMVKKEVLHLRQIIGPQREVLARFARGEFKLIRAHLVPYYRNVYDALFHIGELAQTYTDSLTGILQVYLNMASNQTSEVVKLLTLITLVTTPMMMIGTWYGMNFDDMHELKTPHGYQVATVVMVVSTIATFWYFKMKKWF